MPNTSIFDSVSAAWSSEDARGKKVLDLSCGGGHTAAMLAQLGYRVVATDYGAREASISMLSYRFARRASTPSI